MSRVRSAPSCTRRRDTVFSRTSSGCSAPSGGGHEPRRSSRRSRADASRVEAARRQLRRDGAHRDRQGPLDAGLSHEDIDAIVLGNGAGSLEGTSCSPSSIWPVRWAHMKPDHPRAHGGLGQLHHRAFTADGTSRRDYYGRVLTVAFENRAGATRCGRCRRTTRSRRRWWRARAASSRHAARVHHALGRRRNIGAVVAANARENAGRSRHAHLREPISVEDVLASPMLWGPDPVSGPARRPTARSRSSWRTGLAKGPRGPRGNQGRCDLHRADVRTSRDQVTRSPVAPARSTSTTGRHQDPWTIQVASSAPFSWYDDVAREPRCAAEQAGRSSTAVTRSSAATARQSVGRRAQHQPDRRNRHAALRRGSCR